jgi:hypothetical protein
VFDVKGVSTRQNITRQNNTTHGKTTQKTFMILNNFLSYMIFGIQMVFWYFRQLVLETKVVMWLVRDKKFRSCLVPRLLVCPVTKTVLQSNTIQLKLSYPSFYILADQTHFIVTCSFHMLFHYILLKNGLKFYLWITFCNCIIMDLINGFFNRCVQNTL